MCIRDRLTPTTGASCASAALAQDAPVVGVSWSNFQEERWKTDEAAIKQALEAAGASTQGLKPALVERLVGVRRRAAASGPTLSPVAFSETDEAEPPSPAKKRVWGLRRRFSPRKLRTRRPRAAALSPEEPSQ